MPANFSTIDLATSSAAQEVVVAAIQHQVCHWEQEFAAAAAAGRLTSAQMVLAI